MKDLLVLSLLSLDHLIQCLVTAIRIPITLSLKTNKEIRKAHGLAMRDVEALTGFSRSYASLHDDDQLNDSPYSTLLMLYCGVHPMFELMERRDKRLFNN